MQAIAEEKPKQPSKLIIHSANYRAIRDGGEQFEVDEFLRLIIAGDSLVLGPIANHSFAINGRNFAPRDPYDRQPKRLRLRYSYANKPIREIVRYEGDLLVLPEDSEVRRLESELATATTQIENIKAEREGERLALRWPHLSCGTITNLGFTNEDFYGGGIKVTNDQMRYASIAHNIRASIKLRQTSTNKEVFIEKGVWISKPSGTAWSDAGFTDKTSLAMREDSRLLIFQWRADKVPRLFFATEPDKTVLDYGEWIIEVKLIGDNFIGDFKLAPLVLTPSGGIPGCV
jgi:hypothetical protein